MPFLTIITATFKSAAFLEACIEHVARERTEEIEHIVVDGGSTDGTLEILEKAADKYPHFRYLHKSDNGQSQAMNRGIEMARGKWLSFLNVDDYYEPEVLRRVTGLLKELPDNVFLTGNCLTRDPEGNIIRRTQAGAFSVYTILDGWFPPNPSAYFYPKSVHNKAGLYNEKNHMSMDLEFLLDALPYLRVVSFNEDWGNFVLHEASKTAIDQMEGQSSERLQTLFNDYRKSIKGFKYIKLCWLYTRNSQTRLGRFFFYIRYPRASLGKIRQMLLGAKS